MVVPPSCPGLNVEVLVDDQPLHEYDNVDEGPAPPTTVTKYIEARSNAHFAVRVKINHDFPFPAGDLEITTIVDQRHTERILMRASEVFHQSGMVIEGCVSHIGDTTDALYKFRFVALDSVEGDIQVKEREKRKLDAVGTISVKLQFIRNRRRIQPKIQHLRSDVFGQLPEKMFKGQTKSHHAGLSQPQPFDTYWWEWDLVGNGPFVMVNFKYRSLAALRALHIIPCEPTPLPLEERPEEELTPEELRQVLRRYKERDAAALKIKKEAATKRARSSTVEADEDDEVEIVEAPRRKRRRGNDEEVIVLD